MKYRSHRGSLAESMKTAIEVSDLEDLARKLGTTGKLTCKWYAKDDRIGWDTWLVCEDGCAIGMSDGNLSMEESKK